MYAVFTIAIKACFPLKKNIQAIPKHICER